MHRSFNSGELSLDGIDKALSIQTLLDYLKLSQEETFAYGDGVNDREMISFVKRGIATGNAKESLNEIANDITDTFLYQSSILYTMYKIVT
jgi:hydroxymethylpyrimidine pyrophosphatase-like HAD family hydrolase